jgi:hypothetical protein
MIGNADQLLHRLADAVEDWVADWPMSRQKSA